MGVVSKWSGRVQMQCDVAIPCHVVRGWKVSWVLFYGRGRRQPSDGGTDLRSIAGMARSWAQGKVGCGAHILNFLKVKGLDYKVLVRMEMERVEV